MKKVLFFIVVLLITSGCTRYTDQPFVIVEKSVYPDTYFLIKTIPTTYYEDTLFTVINDDNFHYMDHERWDQMYFSYNVNDTINFEIKREKLWKRIK